MGQGKGARGRERARGGGGEGIWESGNLGIWGRSMGVTKELGEARCWEDRMRGATGGGEGEGGVLRAEGTM
jgi:hypothetical protein